MKTVIVFQTKALADQICNEIAATPDIEEGVGPVWLWYDPDQLGQTENIVQYNQSADGRCAICHDWSEIDRDWFDAYLNAWIQSGQVQILDELPDDWQDAVENY